MTLGKKCKAKVLEILREELEEKMEAELGAYEEHYDHFIKTGECHGINCEDCPFYVGSGIGSEFTDIPCEASYEKRVKELNKEVAD